MIPLQSPFGLAPMAGMTDTAFRRLVKRQGGCGLVVTEMVSSEGLVRGLDRTLEYAEFTEEERPVAVQIFGGDPVKMARAAELVQDLGADLVDVNMGCPVPKIAKSSAGCSLMREPGHAEAIIASMAKAVRIPVTVKMRAGWNDSEVNAPDLARRLEGAGAAAVTVHGRTAAQSYSGRSDWDLISRVAASVSIPVFGNGDCVEPDDLLRRLRSSGVAGVLVGRGALRNPWLFGQAEALAAGEAVREVTLAERGRFLLEYLDLLLKGDAGEAAGFRHRAGNVEAASAEADRGSRLARGRDRWVINKIRALSAWYTRGFENGSHLRQSVNNTETLAALRSTIIEFFGVDVTLPARER